MALKKVVERLTKPVGELDRQKLEAFCTELGVTAITDVTPRTQVRVAGEVRSVLIVPRAGAPALEVTVSDGRGAVTAVFLGRRKIAGMSPGRKVVLDGVTRADGARLLVYNPRYQLLA
ncbi:MAG: OB-fold nucleic acid binding domain-containing protein [Actinobacteria bacterium]|nr:OB-fold nucleic acid binding domain-containing protein [Actinomycetota bacterium]